MIRKAQPADAGDAAALAAMLWPDAEGLYGELLELITRSDAAIFLKYEHERAVGFAQCQLRYDYVEGTDSSPVGYMEGLYICEGFRRRGYARELLAACEMWAKSLSCAEFASDCELSNADSLRFHLKTGFTEANRIICFTKSLK